jgi:YidC/Oxa1 family membrane protein insertase
MFDIIFNSLADALAFFYEVWPSYGGAIFLFSLVIMLLLSPLSIKSTRGMIRMQKLQPEVKRLQAQYKDDREGLNRETMALYQANSVNPFSRCLPLLLQSPVLIVLFQVLRGLTRNHTAAGTFDPKYLSHDSALYQALHGAKEMRSFGIDLSQSATSVLSRDGVVNALPFIILVAVVVGLTFYQQRQIAGRNQNQSQQQQMMTKVLPFIFIPITISFPAGVVVYYAVSTAVRVGQQAIVTRLESGGEGGGFQVVTPPPSAPPASSNGKAAPRPTSDSGRVTQPGQRQVPVRNNKKKRR